VTHATTAVDGTHAADATAVAASRQRRVAFRPRAA